MVHYIKPLFENFDTLIIHCTYFELLPIHRAHKSYCTTGKEILFYFLDMELENLQLIGGLSVEVGKHLFDTVRLHLLIVCDTLQNI